MACHGGEIKPLVALFAQLLEDLQQPLVDGVELAEARKAILQPVPLDDGGLQRGRGRIGIVFQELWRSALVHRQIEAAVDRVLVLVPGTADQVMKLRRNEEAVQKVVFDGVLNGVKAKLI